MIVLFLLSVYAATMMIAHQAQHGRVYLTYNLMFSPEPSKALKMREVEILQHSGGHVVLVGGDNRVLEVEDNGVLRRVEFKDLAGKVTNLATLSSVELDPNDVEKIGFVLALINGTDEYKILTANGKCLVMTASNELVIGTSEQCTHQISHFDLVLTKGEVPLAQRRDNPDVIHYTGNNGAGREDYASVPERSMPPTHIARFQNERSGGYPRYEDYDSGYNSGYLSYERPEKRRRPEYHPPRSENPERRRRLEDSSYERERPEKRRSLWKKKFPRSFRKRGRKHDRPSSLESDYIVRHKENESDTRDHDEESMKHPRSETHDHGERHLNNYPEGTSKIVYYPILPFKDMQLPPANSNMQQQYPNSGSPSAPLPPQNSQLYPGQTSPLPPQPMYTSGPLMPPPPAPLPPQPMYTGGPPMPQSAVSYPQGTQPYPSIPPTAEQLFVQPSNNFFPGESDIQGPFDKEVSGRKKMKEKIKKFLGAF